MAAGATERGAGGGTIKNKRLTTNRKPFVRNFDRKSPEYPGRAAHQVAKLATRTLLLSSSRAKRDLDKTL
jgi:hypothetical protein